MIEQHYSKDTSHAYQTLITNIHATKTEVFRLLATTDGISSWFPQLSINKKKMSSLFCSIWVIILLKK